MQKTLLRRTLRVVAGRTRRAASTVAGVQEVHARRLQGYPVVALLVERHAEAFEAAVRAAAIEMREAGPARAMAPGAMQALVDRLRDYLLRDVMSGTVEPGTDAEYYAPRFWG